mmetsp:Transcript_29344/g.82764  ORF Transcript_29344/g.82764 Transcript_29344/m.82764 type:complete len:628 (-) Transcript_29344:181-2064(-)|eukprot:CAMPEP_0117697900 /NCGR_PEP_ID=MMETSP0804-20121206/29483_1 /TAXON_ID=1074897 /ORGANISM="Tetraselmis astigmatica, Strain CCMP880" /LENGTH=627 /DNA_ID=CAMNT_0005512197 /DNA_START=55 /DNA_END=1941 /DNA_ORIENTATION=+
MAVLDTADLLSAIKTGDSAELYSLIRGGADPTEGDEAGRTPLSWVAELGNAHVAQVLLEDPNLQLNSPDKFGRAPIHYAAAHGRADVMKVLLGEGAKVKLVDKQRCTPLHYAAAAGHAVCVELLLDHSPSIINVREQNGYTALVLASSVGHLNTVKALLGRSADFDTPSEEGKTALMMACVNNHPSVVEALVQAGANPDLQESQGEIAVGMTKDEDVQRILQNAMAASSLYRDRFIILKSQPAVATSYGLTEEGQELYKGMMVTLRFYRSLEQRDAMVDMLSQLSSDFVANVPVVSDWSTEVAHYVFSDASRHPEAPHCLVVTAGEILLQDVVAQSSLMSFSEIMLIFRSIMECVEHLHLRNLVHCNLSMASFMRYHDGVYRLVDLHDCCRGGALYSGQSLKGDVDDTVPPELADFFLGRGQKEAAKLSRDMWSLGGILMFMITGCTITQAIIQLAQQMTDSSELLDGSTRAVLLVMSRLQQESVNKICSKILERSLRTYSVKIPSNKASQSSHLATEARKKPAVLRLLDVTGMMKALLSVEPRERPTCTQVLNYRVFNMGPSIKNQELLKLQMNTAQAEARQLALMQDIAGTLKVALSDPANTPQRSRGSSISSRGSSFMQALVKR